MAITWGFSGEWVHAAATSVILVLMNPNALLSCLPALTLLTIGGTLQAAKQPAPPPLNATGETLVTDYLGQLEEARATLKAALPKIHQANEAAFLKAHADEGPQFTAVKKGSKEKPKQKRDTGVYKQFPRQFASVAKARPVLKELDAFLASDALDKPLVKAAVIGHATPAGLAAYAQQSSAHQARIDALLGDHELMKEMLVAGGPMAGRYGEAMEILERIRAASKQPHEGIFKRLAIGTALELCAPDLSPNYARIDPVRRYLAYEKWHLAGELDPHFKDMTTWECRYIINDYEDEETLAWLRTVLNNYRPDTVDTEYPGSKYMALNSEIPQKTPQYDEDISRMQSIVVNGGRCGPKAALGRATTRAFGIPTWGARVKAHTGMTYWTPHGWTTALGVAFTGSFWDKDGYNMESTLFSLDALAREHETEYLKALRCLWLGDALGQERIHGRQSGSGGFWHALALNKRRAIVADAFPKHDPKRPAWVESIFALIQDYQRPAEKDSPLVDITLSEVDRRIESKGGVITIPAAACVSPTENTGKILFMESRLGGVQVHYNRKGPQEELVYEVEVPAAGDYLLSSKVVTIGRDQSLDLKLNDGSEWMKVPLPFRPGEWAESEPVPVTLKQGKNTLRFTRIQAEDYGKAAWTRSGPEYGGVSIREFKLKAK